MLHHLSFLLCLVTGLFLFSETQASTVEMQRGIVLRQASDDSGVLEPIGYLQPGSVVRIPMQFIEEHGEGEKALMAWLAKSGELRQFSTPDGVKRDYYFPVELVNDQGPGGLKAGTIAMVPIRYLVRNKGFSMVITEGTEVLKEAKTQENIKSNGNQQIRDTVTSKKELTPHLESLNYLKYHMKTAISSLEAKTKNNVRNRRGPEATFMQFNRTCNVSYERFYLELKQVAGRQFVPAELLLAIMHLETGGRCDAFRREHDGSASVGLFQVNTKSTSVRLCQPWQLRMINTASSFELLKDADLNCLQNPLINLEEAARILRSKYALVNSRKQPADGRWYNFRRQARDDWRKAIAAYSGGQGYVFQAYHDIQAYNRTQGTNLDPDNWENRRLFFFRRILDAKVDKQFFDESMKYRRSLGNILINMAYVESITGRDAQVEKPQKPLIVQWIEKLYFSI